MDKNGYNDSIMDTVRGVCFACHWEGDTARHEIFYGTANRRNSKKYGTWVYLCPVCHDQVHLKPDGGEMDRYLKHEGYKEFCKIHPRYLFYKTFGRAYD